MSRFHSRQDCQGGNIAVGRRYQGSFEKNFERRSFEKANLNTAITDMECICLYRSIDSSSLQNIVSLFFLFRVRYKICTRCCQEALQRSKFDRLTLPCYTTIQIPVTGDFLAPIGALVVTMYVHLSVCLQTMLKGYSKNVNKEYFKGHSKRFILHCQSLNPVLFMSLFGHALFNYNPPKRSREVW